MANAKSYTVQYIIKARDEFSAAAGKARDRLKDMRAELGRLKKAFQENAAAMRRNGAIMTAAVTTPILLAAASLKNAARDAEETRSKFGTVFRDISTQAQSSAKALADNYGLASTKSMQLLGDTGDLLAGFGFTQEEALKTSVSVNQLAVDLASFTNFAGGAEGASAALTKALLGERESLKSLGIAISEENVKTKIRQMLAEGATFSSLRQAKAQATLALAYEQSKNAVGDFARTQGQLANQERITSARIQDLKESFGRLLLPVALKVTQAIRGVVESLLNMSPVAKKAVVIVAAMAAAIGPLLLGLGSMALLWPALTAGAAMFGAVTAIALGPLLPLILAVAAGAALIVANWDKVSAFFGGLADGLQSTLSPTLAGIVADFQEAAGVVASWFGADSEATKSLFEFANAGQFVGEVIGSLVTTLINGLSGIGEILGQLIAATVSLDFTQFDAAAIKAEFLGMQAKPVQVDSRVDVGVTVGLDKGLTQSAPVTVGGAGERRADVGVN